jgi:hypothetical protein
MTSLECSGSESVTAPQLHCASTIRKSSDCLWAWELMALVWSLAEGEVTTEFQTETPRIC